MKKFIFRFWLLLLILSTAAFLRIYKLNDNPVSLFGDELDVGYHAYSILKTGKDYYGNPWPIHFHSIAEWRTPLYLYASVPTVAVYGISPLGVRLPAAISGILGVWGIYLLVTALIGYGADRIKNSGNKSQVTNKRSLALITAAILSINPWHLQYSRAGFEVTMLLTFLIFGLYFFFVSLRSSGKYLWLSIALLTFTPWIYSTAKLFTPLLLVFLFFYWRREILAFRPSVKIKSILIGLIVGLPIAYSTFFGGGTERAQYTSVFTDPTIPPEVGFMRETDARVRGEAKIGTIPSFSDRFYHNKLVVLSKNISANYLESLSTAFLFIKGDANMRHSPKGVGEFYKVEIISLLIGIVFFFTSIVDRKVKYLILCWTVIGILPASLTRDGGNHATRLILILPPLVFLIAYGVLTFFKNLKNIYRYIFVFGYSLTILTGFLFYLHYYYVHYPRDSARWWHYGFEEVMKTTKSLDADYDKVIFSMAGEPVWIFFAGWYQYPPEKWQKEFPIGNNEYLPGFGDASHTGKYYFAQFDKNISLFALAKYIDKRTLYVAVPSEIGEDLVMNPEKGPGNLKLIKAIAYPSGEPAYYIFAKK